jgi:hypothetical protein
MAMNAAESALANIDEQIEDLIRSRDILAAAIEATNATAAPAAPKKRGRGKGKAKPGLPAAEEVAL